MKTINSILTALVALVLLTTACSPQATPTAAAATDVPTMAPAAPAATVAQAGTMVAVAKDPKLGTFLVDDKGMSLYLFTKDTPNTTVCYDKCATAWPPLLTTGAPVGGDGVDATKLGTTKRTDGSMQVTYNGWPLYYFEKDKNPGDVTGQNVGQVWYVVSPAGDKVVVADASTVTPTTAAADATAAPTTAAAMATGPANVMVTKNDALGSFLADDKGMTLYLYTKDTPNTTVCYDKCATAWPPLLTKGAPVAGAGVDATKLGTTTRKDGSMQVTYNGWPLYYFVKDAKAGDTAGQGVGTVWYVLSPAGDQINK